ncbi:MAG: sulfite exporter TauE/SafE family protein [Halieaceae bacterium]|nr:sulfite exporter TauE/SafE family protein [Halieaceae bacterium]
MEYLLVCAAACLASGLTLFSGFGLGTLLMPVVALFFPLEVAVAITAVVHLANNLFKLGLVGREANPGVILRFGIPAVLAALVGAVLLAGLSDAAPLHEYQALGRELVITPIKLVVGLLIIGFVALELWPRFAAIAIDPKFLPFGGLLSGFFGGLSGHQGAFRSMFLIKAGLTKEAFVATGVVIAVMVDCARLGLYGLHLGAQSGIDWSLVAAASLSAFLGAYLGRKWLEKITLQTVRYIVSALLLAVGLGLVTGLM